MGSCSVPVLATLHQKRGIALLAKLDFLNIYNIEINYGLTICNISLSCCSTKNQITLHSCPRFAILNAQQLLGQNLFNNYWYYSVLLFSDWHGATVSPSSRNRNDKENSKFHCCHYFLVFSSLNLSIVIGNVWYSERRKIQGKEVQFSLSFLWISGSRIYTVKFWLWLCLCEYYIISLRFYKTECSDDLILMLFMVTLNILGSWTYLPAYDHSWIDWVHGKCG